VTSCFRSMLLAFCALPSPASPTALEGTARSSMIIQGPRYGCSKSTAALGMFKAGGFASERRQPRSYYGLCGGGKQGGRLAVFRALPPGLKKLKPKIPKGERVNGTIRSAIIEEYKRISSLGVISLERSEKKLWERSTYSSHGVGFGSVYRTTTLLLNS